MVAPPQAYGGDFDRCWLLAVQLYGVRSARNWGIGDFTDLEGVIALAAGLGAGGVGLNPLHALFDDRPGDCSPYSPNSRLFLNPLYIDVEKLPGVSPGAECRRRIEARRHRRLRCRRQTEMAGAAFRIREVQGRCGGRRSTRSSKNSVPSAAPAAGAVCLLRGAAAQIPKAMVGLARTLATARRGSMRRVCAKARIALQSNSSNSCNGSPTGSYGIAAISPRGSA